MKKRWLSLLLTLVMVVACFTPVSRAMGDYSGNLTNATWYWPIHGYSSSSSAYGKISSSYGYRGGEYNKFHYGVDIGEAKGTEVYATRAGTVETVVTSLSSAAGRHVVVNHQDGYYSVYMHLSSVNVTKGQSVDQNTLIGKVGGSGTSETSYAAHLHLGIHYGSSYSSQCNVNPCPSGYTRVGASFKESNGGYPVGEASIAYTLVGPIPSEGTTLTFSDLTTPGTLTVGSVGHIDGKITSSNSPIVSVTAQVLDTSVGKVHISSSSSGFSVQSYGPLNGSKVDNDLKFGSLDVGVYYIKYTATAKDGTVGVERTETFQVVDKIHTHTYVQGYEAAHPHKVYMKCSVCGDYYYTGATTTMSSCEICNPSHTHTLTHVAAKTVTCEADGNIEYWYCADCGKYFANSTATTEIAGAPLPIEKLGHKLTYVPAKAATETAEGNTEYWSCSRCGKYFSDGAATREISLNSTVIPKLTHVHNLIYVPYKEVSEEADGNIEYWYCSSCGKAFSDSAAVWEIDLNSVVISKLIHTHTLTEYPAKAATCIAAGNLEYWYCEKCGKYFSDFLARDETTLSAVTLEKLNHDLTYVAAKAATESTAGNKEYWYCTRCGQYFLDEAAMVESTLEAVAVDKPEKEWVDVHFDKQTLYFQGQFTDIPANQWFTSSVAEAYELGLMKGNSASTFNPYGDMTLAEAITMAARIHAIYTNGQENFVQSGTWYQVYLDYAYSNEIINRAYYNADVTRKATRAQFAEIFANALPDGALYPINAVADNAIPDVPMGMTYAPYVYKLYRAGILTGGDSMGTFSPDTYITRSEAAAIVSRMAESNNRKNFTL